jgi:hypothetical protein
MMKRLAVLPVLTLSWIVISGLQPEPTHNVNAYAISSGSAFHHQAVPAASKVTWEYRILNGNAFQLATLESSINRLTEQGYTVESLHPVSSISGGRTDGADSPVAIKSVTEVFVLLRRIRR